MKKRITQKLLATVAVACLMIGGVFAQTHDGGTIPGAIANYAGSDVQGTTYITEGTTVPMWVSPDAYFHPNYVPGTTYTLTDGFTWTFSGTATTGLTVTQTPVDIPGDNNYITVAAAAGDAAASPYTLTVTENAPAAFGGCAGSPVNLTITVVAAPNFSIGGDDTYEFCAGNAGLPSAIQSTITGGWQNYRLAWNLEIATLNDLGAKEFYYDDETGAGRVPAQKYVVDYTEAVPQEIATAAAAPDLMTVGSFLAINNGTRAAVTVYTYNVISINDRASRFGDFIGLAAVPSPTPGQFTYYANAETVTVTIYPAPVTGPIYHINNTWAD